MERQAKLTEFYPCIIRLYVPAAKRYAERRGLAERVLRLRLEKHGWKVWRGDLYSMSKHTEYPSVLKAYAKLCSQLDQSYPGMRVFFEYLAAVHHGMPDFICYRQGKWKFVECKLQYEQLSRTQKICIKKLVERGFRVEVHILVDERTKKRVVREFLETGEQIIEEEQLIVARARRTLARPRSAAQV